jgi:c-di-AMP phosphodiesterase-like protein
MKTFSILLTALLCAIYTFVIVTYVHNQWSSLIVAIGIFVIIYVISKIETNFNTKDK